MATSNWYLQCRPNAISVRQKLKI